MTKSLAVLVTCSVVGLMAPSVFETYRKRLPVAEEMVEIGPAVIEAAEPAEPVPAPPETTTPKLNRSER